MTRKESKISIEVDDEFGVHEHTPLESILDNSIQKAMDKHLNELIRKQDNIAELPEKAPSPWKLSVKGKEAVSQGVALFQTSYGLYAAIPMICKGEDCAYAKLFPELHEAAIEEGDRCPVEVAFIMTKYDQYVTELEIQPTDAVDMSILRDLIDYDVQILRADNKMTTEGDFVKDMVVASDESGRPIFREEISQAAVYKEKIQTRRNKSLEMLHSTRKDKAGSKTTITMDPSSYAAELLKRAKSSDEDGSIEASFEELEFIDDVPYMQNIREEQDVTDKEKEAMQAGFIGGER